MQQVLVELTPILHEIAGSIEKSGEVEMEPLVVGDETFTFVEPVRFRARVTNASGGFVAEGEVAGVARVDCSRCLEPFDTELRGEIEGFYVMPGAADEIPEEQEYELVRDNRLDLLPAIRSALAVEAPFAPIHSEECKGICPECGANRNFEDCRCEPEDVSSPFDSLKGMFGGEE